MHPALGGRPAGPPRAHWRSGRSRERPVCAAATARGHPVHRTPVQAAKRSGAARPPAASARPGRVPGTRDGQAGYPPDGPHVRGQRRTRAGAPGSGTARSGAPAPGVLARGLDARAGRSVHRPHRTDSRRRGQDTIAPVRSAGRSRA